MSDMAIVSTLSTHLKEEIKDAETYISMAKTAKDAGDSHMCKYLMAMAKDEYSHAKFIHEEVMKAGMTPDPADVAAFITMETHLKELL